MDKDFSIEFPEMADMPSLLMLPHKDGRMTNQQFEKDTQEVREKYFTLLDKHNLLLEANIALREENIELRDEISNLRKEIDSLTKNK